MTPPPINEETVLARLRAQYEAEKVSGEPTGAINAELIFDLLDATRKSRRRLELLELNVAALAEIPARVDALEANVAALADLPARVAELEAEIAALAGLPAQVAALESQQHRALVVAALPASADEGVLIRLEADPLQALYVGNGPNLPLTQFLPPPLV